MAYVGVTANICTERSMLILLRIFGVWLVLLAMVAAVVDATKKFGGGRRVGCHADGRAMAGPERR